MSVEIQAVGLQEVKPLQKGMVMPPTPVAGNNQVIELYNRSTSPNKMPLQHLRIQNQNNTKVYIAINADATAAVYNEILIAAVAAKDGSGGVFEIPMGWAVDKVTIFAPGAFEVSYTLVLNANNVRY